MAQTSDDRTTRRDFHRLAMAALGGAIAGSLTGCGDKNAGPAKTADTSNDAAKKTAATDATPDGEKTAKPAGAKPDIDENLLLVSDPHICRGLNQCKSQGKGKENSCAGQGACATAEKHSCDGLNVCKGQGGCGEYPGQNKCKGQGACAVPLKPKTWAKARSKYEDLMKKAGKKFGDAPALSEEQV